jgi:hypothetical protein
MTPVVYQNLGGTESLWSANTVCTDAKLHRCDGDSLASVQCYRRCISRDGCQQQTWTNGGDGVWRFMPSIAVDNCGDAAIGLCDLE